MEPSPEMERYLTRLQFKKTYLGDASIFPVCNLAVLLRFAGL
jgi:hypothetical protein